MPWRATAQKGRIDDIQIARAIAILMVLFTHLSIGATIWAHLIGTRFYMPTWSGVELFFVISGYVVTKSLMRRDFSISIFFVRRFFRLMPALICFVAVAAIPMALAYAFPVGAFGKSEMLGAPGLFLADSLRTLTGSIINGSVGRLYQFSAMWSLSVEFQFYAGFGLAMWLASRSRQNGWKFLTWVTAILLAIMIAARLVRPSHLFEIDEAPLGLAYLARWSFDALLVGIVIARLPDVKWLSQKTGAVIAACALVIALVTLSFGENYLAGPAPLLLGPLFVVMLGCYATIIKVAGEGKAFSYLPAFARRILSAIGDWSYSAYLFHFPVFAIYWIACDRLFPSVFYRPWAYEITQAVVMIPIVFGLSALSYRFVELPFQAMGNSLAKRLSRLRVDPVAQACPAE